MLGLSSKPSRGEHIKNPYANRDCQDLTSVAHLMAIKILRVSSILRLSNTSRPSNTSSPSNASSPSKPFRTLGSSSTSRQKRRNPQVVAEWAPGPQTFILNNIYLRSNVPEPPHYYSRCQKLEGQRWEGKLFESYEERHSLSIFQCILLGIWCWYSLLRPSSGQYFNTFHDLHNQSGMPMAQCFTPRQFLDSASSQSHEETGYASPATTPLPTNHRNRGIRLVGSERVPTRAKEILIVGRMNWAIVRARVNLMPQYFSPLSAVPYALIFFAHFRLRGGISDSWNNDIECGNWDNEPKQQMASKSRLRLNLCYNTCRFRFACYYIFLCAWR